MTAKSGAQATVIAVMPAPTVSASTMPTIS